MNNDRFKFRVFDTRCNRYCTKNRSNICIGIGEKYFTETGYIIEQCTGLKDKNGKLIFEGDKCVCEVLEFSFWRVVYGVITWNESECGFIITEIYSLKKFHIGKVIKIEIIGTIHKDGK